MKNSEIVNEILRIAEENHINLFHDVTKEEIEEYLSKLTNIDNFDNVKFDYEMLKLFHKFKDAHTSYYVKYEHIDKQLFYVENKLLIKDNNEFFEVVSVADVPTKKFISQLEEMINYETEEYLCDSIRAIINNHYYYEMLGLSSEGKVNFSIMKNNKKETIIANQICFIEFKELFPVEPTPNYACEMLEDNILYIKYKRCFEHKNYTFSKFVEDVKCLIEQNNSTQFIVDLRDNHGGDSSIIKPLIDLLKEKSLEGALIINNGVFSSGRWAVADFKKNFNTPTFGEPTGGAAASYGYNKNLQVKDKNFSVSIRFWDFSKIFGTTGAIQPDFYVATKLEDLKNGVDSQLDACKNYLNQQYQVN